MSLLAVGTVAFDSIEPPNDSRQRIQRILSGIAN